MEIQEEYKFDFIMGILIPGIFCVFGILGNSVSLVVLSSDRSRCPTFVTLKALAISDIILLFFALVQQVIPVYILISHCVHVVCLNIGYIRIYTWPVICIAQMTSVWLTVLISAERYSAICRPLHAPGMCNVSRVKISIVTLTIISFLFNLPKFFEFYPKEDIMAETNLTFITLGDTELRRDPLYRYLYNTASYCLLVYALPLIVITILNINIVIQLRKARIRWEDLNRQQQREVKATAIPLCIVGVFFICGTQSLIAFILDAIFVNQQHSWLQTYTAVVNLFVIFNSAVNFVIFYLFGSKFRALLRMQVTCRHRGPNFGSFRGSPIFRRQFRNHMSLSSVNGFTRGRSDSCVASVLYLQKDKEQGTTRL